MPAFIDLATLHTPAANLSPPASWGLQVRDNLETLVRPPRQKVYHTTGVSIPNATTTAVAFNTSSYDAGYDGVSPHWSSGQPTRVYIRRSGLYVVSFTLRVGVGVATYTARYAFVRADGVTNDLVTIEGAAGNAWYWGGSAAEVVPLTSGQYLELMVYHANGAALQAGPPVSLSAYWLGYLS